MCVSVPLYKAVLMCADCLNILYPCPVCSCTSAAIRSSHDFLSLLCCQCVCSEGVCLQSISASVDKTSSDMRSRIIVCSGIPEKLGGCRARGDEASDHRGVRPGDAALNENSATRARRSSLTAITEMKRLPTTSAETFLCVCLPLSPSQ